MIVSLSLILIETGLRMRCQQIVTHWNSLGCLSCVHVAYECDRRTALDESYHESTLDCVLVSLRLTGLVRLAETQDSYYTRDGNGGNATYLRRIYAQTKLCHFLRNRDSRYCFLSCNRCSWRLNKGHLLILSAIFIFLHLSSNIRSIAANILMFWSLC